MKSINPAVRSEVLKVMLNEAEMLAFRRKCTGIGMTCSPTARQLINNWAPTNDSDRRVSSERPWAGRVSPNSGRGIPIHRLRV